MSMYDFSRRAHKILKEAGKPMHERAAKNSTGLFRTEKNATDM